jgi:hypothetical protein
MPINYAQLTTELQTDPRSYGYAPFIASGSDQTLADMLNLVRTGSNGGPAISIKRDDVQSSEVYHALELSDLVTNPGASQLQWFSATLLAAYPIQLLNADGSSTPVRTNILALLKSGASASKTRLGALETRLGSRAEELFGGRTYINSADVARALGR